MLTGGNQILESTNVLCTRHSPELVGLLLLWWTKGGPFAPMVKKGGPFAPMVAKGGPFAPMVAKGGPFAPDGHRE